MTLPNDAESKENPFQYHKSVLENISNRLVGFYWFRLIEIQSSGYYSLICVGQSEKIFIVEHIGTESYCDLWVLECLIEFRTDFNVIILNVIEVYGTGNSIN